jgi:hypothetical protein
MGPATHREIRRYGRSDVQTDVVKRAAKRCKWKITESDGGLLTIRVRLSFWSWGERMTVALGTVEGCCLVDITSTCILWTQFVDMGRNERNVRRLFDKIDEILGDGSEHVQCPLCSNCGYLLVSGTSGICPECGQEYPANNIPLTQESATIKNAVIFALAATVVEVLILGSLDMLDAFGGFGSALGPAGSALHLLCLNLVSMIAGVGLHRLIGHIARRR